MANFKMATPQHIKKVLKQMKSQYKSLVNNKPKFEAIQTSCVNKLMQSNINAGAVKLTVIA